MSDKPQSLSAESGAAVGREAVQVLRRGAELTAAMAEENERLRARLAAFETGPTSVGDAMLQELTAKVRRLEQERDQVARRFAQVEAENKDFASRYVQVENENSNLMAIYIASYQLHSTLDFDEVVQIITEIILNFVGAEVFGIGWVDEKTGQLLPLIAEGFDPQAMTKLSQTQGTLGQVLQQGEPHFVTAIENLQVDLQSPGVCIPLKIKEKVIGVIAVYRFLPQKTHLAHVDHELFTLLAGHAATAIFSAKLYTDSRRKLDTIQGLIDLVTS